jgi:mono/diheme cytochrome c family protein
MKRKLAFTIPILLFLAACGSSTSNSSSQNSPSTNQQEISAEPRSGETVYKDKCVLCHGDDGKKGLMGAVDLTTNTATHDAVVAIITNGKKSMTAFGGQLSKEEIEAVAKYAEEMRK